MFVLTFATTSATDGGSSWAEPASAQCQVPGLGNAPGAQRSSSSTSLLKLVPARVNQELDALIRLKNARTTPQKSFSNGDNQHCGRSAAPASTGAAFDDKIKEWLSPWRGTVGLLSAMERSFWGGLRPWCRVFACVVNGELHVRALEAKTRDGKLCAPESIHIQRAAAALIGLANTLRRFPIPDVCVMLSCQDRPIQIARPYGSKLNPSSTPPLAFAYMSSADHFDVPWPDYLFAGMPSKHIGPWDVASAQIQKYSDSIPFMQRRPLQLYAQAPQKQLALDTLAQSRLDRSVKPPAHYGYHPLRLDFTNQCVRNCSRAAQHLFLEVQASQILSGKLGLKPNEITGAHLGAKCAYQSILVMNGRSAWLDHFPHDLSCGSAVVQVIDRSRPLDDGHHDSEPVYAFYSHLLSPGQHYLRIDADHAMETEPLCEALADVQHLLRRNPALAECIGSSGQEVMRWLTADRVYEYQAKMLARISEMQAESVHRAVLADTRRAALVAQRGSSSSPLSVRNLTLIPADLVRRSEFMRIDHKLDACIASGDPTKGASEQPVECAMRVIKAAQDQHRLSCVRSTPVLRTHEHGATGG